MSSISRSRHTFAMTEAAATLTECRSALMIVRTVQGRPM